MAGQTTISVRLPSGEMKRVTVDEFMSVAETEAVIAADLGLEGKGAEMFKLFHLQVCVCVCDRDRDSSDGLRDRGILGQWTPGGKGERDAGRCPRESRICAGCFKRILSFSVCGGGAIRADTNACQIRMSAWWRSSPTLPPSTRK